MAVQVAIYTRVSREDTEEPQSTRRQERACREFARMRNWDVADVWEDVDVSAYSRDVIRPAYNDLLRIVAGGRVNGVLVWKLDRLVRRAADFEQFWERCDRAGVFLASATEPIDSTTEIGLAVIRMLVNFANVESTSISLRIRAKMLEKARSGIPLWQHRPFGYNEDATSLIEDEAVFIREGAARILAEEPARAIADDWNERHIPTNTGTPWTGQRIAQMLRHPRLVGDNEFRGEIVAKGCFPSVLDPLVYAQVQVHLENHRHRRVPGRPYPLAGLLRCGKCGSRLCGYPFRRRLASGTVVEHRTYGCSGSGCASLNIKAEFVEELVVEATLCRIEARQRLPLTIHFPTNGPEVLAKAYALYAARIKELAGDYYVRRRLTVEEWQAARDGLDRELNSARREFDPVWRPTAMRRHGKPLRFRQEWQSLDVRHQRDIIASELEYAVIHPTKAKGWLDATRVEPHWWETLNADYPWESSPRSKARQFLDPDLMPLNEVARLIGVSQCRAAVYIKRGYFTGVRVGRRWRVPRSEAELLASRTVGSLGTADVAVLMGVSKGAVKYWVTKGLLPAHKSRGSFHIQPEALSVWAEELKSLVGPKEAAELLGISVGSVRRMLQTGKLHALKRGVVWTCLDRNEVTELVRQRHESPSRARATGADR